MQLKAIRVENFGGVRLVAAPIGPGVTTVEGDNGSGKSSFLDGIATLFNGKAAIPADPVHEGAARAVVIGQLDGPDGQLTVTATMTARGAYKLSMRGADGALISRPMEALSALRGCYGIDPLELASATDAGQVREMILRALEVDVSAIDAEEKRLRQSRETAGRERKRLGGALSQMPTHDDNAPAEEVSAADLMRELSDAEEVRRRNQTAQREAEELGTSVEEQRARVADLEHMIREAREKLDADLLEWSAARRAIDGLEEPDIDGIRERIASVDIVNGRVRANQTRATTKADHDAAALRWDELSAEIRECGPRRAALLAEAGCEVPGLELVGEEVRLHGRPWAAASTGERMVAALQLRCQSKPALRVAWTKHGDCLDETNLAAMREFCVANNLQVIMERTGHRSEEALLIVDGSLANADVEELTV